MVPAGASSVEQHDPSPPRPQTVTESPARPMSSAVPPWLPNLITGIRIALVLVFLVVAEAERAAATTGAGGRAAGLGALAVFLAIGLSDLADGWVARRFGLQSQSGAILDAFADKLAQVVVLAYLTLSTGPPFTSIPMWLLLVVVARDLLLGGSWLVTALQGRPVRVIHRPHGKIASTLLFFLLLGVLAGLGPGLVTPWAVVVAAVVIGSTVQYGREGWARLNPPGA